MRARSWLCVAGSAFTITVSEAARADDPPAPAKPPPRVEWNEQWNRFSVAELLISLAVTARDATLGEELDGPSQRTITFNVPLLDDGVRGALRGRSSQVRKTFRNISDVTFKGLVLVPFVFDDGIAALAAHHNPDVAAQLALIDFEVLTVAGMVQLSVAREVGRARPNTNLDDCDPSSKCSGDPYRSFLSGHSMAAFTAAGLICLHHEKLPLYGGGAPDIWACTWGLLAAATSGVSRIVADEHWTSDVIIGSSTGLLFGYFLPKLLHFTARKTPRLPTVGGMPLVPTFTGTADSAQLGVAALF